MEGFKGEYFLGKDTEQRDFFAIQVRYKAVL
jgi:hypothetical protein